jgi:hypothetical protein
LPPERSVDRHAITGARSRPGRRWPTAERSKRRGVIDARGFANSAALDLGWQKFVGQPAAAERPTGSTGR